MTSRLPIALALLAAALPAVAQPVAVPSSHPRVRAALERLRADNAWTLEQQASICEIPAPPFGEERRGAEMRRRFEALGLRARIDSVGNVIAELPDASSGDGGPTVVLAAHLDTVFPEETDVTVTRAGTRLSGPGIGDDCRGLAVLLAVARALRAAEVRTGGTVLFVANVGEEGPGNLRGVRHLFDRELQGEIDYFISVDGTGHGIVSRAVGSNRYRVTYEGPGGHSYGAFGMPNPIHALGRAIARIAEVKVPSSPRTTFNVGVIAGGTSVNSISASASMDVDMRSESAASLASLDSAVRRALREALEEERARWPSSRASLALRIDTIGIRPAGAQPDSARIVRAAQAALRAIGVEPERLAASSTDANVPIAMGIPGISIDGGGEGRGAHSLGEWYDDGARGWTGPQWAALLVVTLAGAR
jgi:acetylornithine deacetylase/succinyl-diaminopimelate desuccinylase-like protein